MKNNRKTAFIALLASLGLVSACKKSDMNMAQSELNINYPAAYVVNGESSTVSVINTSTNTVAGTINLENGSSNMADMIMYPHHAYLSPDKKMVSLGVPGMDLSAGHTGGMAGMQGKIALLDAAKGTLVKVINLPIMNHNAIFSADGTEIWTSQMDKAGKVLVYDATAYTLKNTITVGMEPAEVTFSADGKVAFVANGEDNTVTAINAATKAVLKTIAVGANPVGAWTGTDNKMYVDNEDGKTISIIDVAKLEVTETVNLGFMPGMAAYQGDMKELWVTDPDGGKVHFWTWNATQNSYVHGGAFDTGAGAHAIAFNGMTAYITNQTANTVSVVDVMQHKETKELAVGKKPNGIVLK